MKSTMSVTNTTRLSESNTFRVPLIAILIISVVLLSYFTGGATRSYPHLIYIPIILSAYYWGIRGGIPVAIISGFLIGPFMPLNVSEGIMQSFSNWMIRLIILTLVGFITGYIFQKVKKLDKQARENDLINPLTGTYNTNKLISDLEKRINNGEKFAIFSIKLTNIEQIAKYIEQELAKNILNALVDELSNVYGKDAVSTSGYDEINLVVSPNCSYLEECKRIIKKHSTVFKVNQFKFKINMKIGIYEYIGADESPVEVYNKARIAYEQGIDQETGIYLYDKGFDLSRKELFEISGSLIEAINNNELYLVYQPKINIAENRISGVEVLIRWDRKDKRPVGPDVFIKLAEDIGLIKDISKFVLDTSFNQILEWNGKRYSVGLFN